MAGPFGLELKHGDFVVPNARHVVGIADEPKQAFGDDAQGCVAVSFGEHLVEGRKRSMSTTCKANCRPASPFAGGWGAAVATHNTSIKKV